MTLPKATIMIPTWNQRRYVAQTIESALAQSYENLEVVVCDDCSDDGAWDVIAAYSDHPRARVFRNAENLGRVGNYRRLLELAEGDFVLNLDGDDWLTDADFVAKAMAIAREEPDVVLVFGDRKDYLEETGAFVECSHNRGLPRIMDGKELFLRLPDGKISLYHMTCLYRRDLARRLDFYRANIVSSDWESLWRLLPYGKVGHVSSVAGAWRKHAGNATGLRDARTRLANLEVCLGPYRWHADRDLLNVSDLSRWRRRMLFQEAFRSAYDLLKRHGPKEALRFLAGLRRLDARVWLRVLLIPRFSFRLLRSAAARRP